VLDVGTGPGTLPLLVAQRSLDLSLTVVDLHMPTVTGSANLARTADDRAVGALGRDVLHPALGCGPCGGRRPERL
jgi:hypothetical protein